jgi:hypothetical protein
MNRKRIEQPLLTKQQRRVWLAAVTSFIHIASTVNLD